MRVSITLTKKDDKVRRWMDVVRKNNASVSEYVALAIRYYLSQRKSVALGNVRQAAYADNITTTINIPDDLVAALDQMARQVGNNKRSHLIKTILQKGIEQSGYKTEEITDLYELFDIVLNLPAQESVARVKEKEETRPVESPKEEKREEKPAPVTKEQKSVSDASENKLLGGLFPDFMSQMDDWV